MYVDTFDLKGAKIPIRDSESRKIIEQVLGSISGTAGNSGLPIYLENGVFKPCDNVLDVDILGEAQSAVTATSADIATEANHASSADNATNAINATEANHASSADSATNAINATEANHASSADSATNATTATKLGTSAGGSANPVYFSGGKPVACGSTLAVNITGKSASADKVTLASVVSTPFIRIPINTTNGTVYLLTGSITLSVDTSIIYANSFIGAYTIPIPAGVRFPNGYYSVQLTCQADSKVVIPSLNVTTNLSQLQGYVQSDIKSATDVTFYVLCLGF